MNVHNTRPTRARRLAAVGLLVIGAVLVAGAGAVVGRRWPIERLERLFRGAREPATPGWTVVARTDLPRYEMLRVLVGRQLFLFGGFRNAQPQVTDRVEALDLASGTWTVKRPMPVAVTHTTAVLIGDTVWIAGGFEGDHPGPATARVWRYAVSSDRWSEGPALPAARGGGALVARGDTLHLLGGYLPDRRTDSPDHWMLRPGQPQWERRADLPLPRGHLAVVALDGALYAIGGTHGHDPLPLDVATVQRYDATRDEWVAVTEIPKALSHAEPSSFAYDGQLIVAGGRSFPTGRENLDDVYAFAPRSGQWTHLGRLPVPMLGGVAIGWRDQIVAGLGAPRFSWPETPTLWTAPLRDAWWPSTPMPIALGEVAAGVLDRGLYVVGEGSPHTLRFDIARGDWSIVPDGARPARGHHHAAEVIDGRWYLFGGLGGFSEGRVQIFDPATRAWTLGPEMPFAAGASASAVIGGSAYVAGGIMDGHTTPRMAALDLASMTWRERAPMPRARNHAASVTDGTRLYVFGGRGPGSGDGNEVADGYGDVQIYDPATDRWTVSDGKPGSPLPLPQPRGGTGKAVFVNGEFWVLGGETLAGPGATANGVYARVDIYDATRNRWRAGPPLLTARHGAFPVVHEGRLLVAGGGESAGYAVTSSFEVLWARSAGHERR